MNDCICDQSAGEGGGWNPECKPHAWVGEFNRKAKAAQVRSIQYLFERAERPKGTVPPAPRQLRELAWLLQDTITAEPWLAEAASKALIDVARHLEWRSDKE
jgi:hypothetical protein